MTAGYSFLCARNGKVYKNPVIKSDLGEVYFSDGDPEVLFKVDEAEFRGLRKTAQQEKLRKMAKQFFDSVDNIVRFDTDGEVRFASERGLAYVDVLMNKRVKPSLITEHEGVFEPGDSAIHSGAYVPINGP